MTRTQVLIISAAAAALLSACSSDGRSFSDRFAGSGRVRGDADSVTVLQAGSVADALPLAMGHCAHFKKAAQYESHQDAAFRFRCVAS